MAKKGMQLAIALLSEGGTPPDIVQDFLTHPEILHKIVQKATLEILEDIRSLLYDERSMSLAAVSLFLR